VIHNDLWREEDARVFSAEDGDFRLIVQAPPAVGGAARFIVLRRGTAAFSDALIGSGTVETVRAAMAAAMRMAERCKGFRH
jgi:hypothetical protein